MQIKWTIRQHSFGCCVSFFFYMHTHIHVNIFIFLCRSSTLWFEMHLELSSDWNVCHSLNWQTINCVLSFWLSPNFITKYQNKKCARTPINLPEMVMMSCVRVGCWAVIGDHKGQFTKWSSVCVCVCESRPLFVDKWPQPVEIVLNE